MEAKIREYEKFIECEVKRDMTEKEKERLRDYHREMVGNFQKERMIHLVVMLFFVVFTMIGLIAVVWTLVVMGVMIWMLPLYVLVLILVVLTGCYVRHYYFLENHVQGLYKYSEKLYKKIS